jgi:TonB family protein
VGILCHELAHVKRRDHVAGLLSELMVVFLPWHPLLWWAKKRLSSLSEHACDDWVIAAGGCGMNYVESLLDLLPVKQMAFVPAVVRNKHVLERRVMRMLRESYENPHLGKKWILSSVLITICVSLSVAFAQTKSAGPDEIEIPGYTQNPVSVSQVVPQISGEAQIALVEARDRFEANPEDFAAARQPLIAYMETHPQDSVPLVMYQMLGQFWYIDEKNERHTEEANQVFAAAYEVFPDNEAMLLNYAITTYELEQFEDAAVLFETYYALHEGREIKYLDYAAAAYYLADNLTDSKRLYRELIDLMEPPDQKSLNSLISISTEMEDIDDAEKYILLAMDYYPSEDLYPRLLANLHFEREEYLEGFAVLYEAGIPLPPESKTSEASDQQQSDDLPNENRVYNLDEIHAPPKVVSPFPPAYPPEAKKNNITGRVLMKFVVTKEGLPRDEQVSKAEPPDVFENAALEAVRQYRFTPGARNGEAVDVLVFLPITFELGESLQNEEVLE